MKSFRFTLTSLLLLFCSIANLSIAAQNSTNVKTLSALHTQTAPQPTETLREKQPTKAISLANERRIAILSPEARQHILYGDKPGSGGHLYPGQPGKSTFPKEWSADKVIHEIEQIATAPDTHWYAQTGNGGLYTKAGQPARWVAYEIRDGVRIRVIYEPATGKIITGFPDEAPVPAKYKPVHEK